MQAEGLVPLTAEALAALQISLNPPKTATESSFSSSDQYTTVKEDPQPSHILNDQETIKMLYESIQTLDDETVLSLLSNPDVSINLAYGYLIQSISMIKNHSHAISFTRILRELITGNFINSFEALPALVNQIPFVENDFAVDAWIATLEALINAGIIDGINKRHNDYGQTVLHIFVIKVIRLHYQGGIRHIDMIKRLCHRLCQNGASPKIKDRLRDTPLEISDFNLANFGLPDLSEIMRRYIA